MSDKRKRRKVRGKKDSLSKADWRKISNGKRERGRMREREREEE